MYRRAFIVCGASPLDLCALDAAACKDSWRKAG